MRPPYPTLDEQRQAAQLRWLASSQELEVGTPEACPMPLAQLAATRGDEPYVVQRFADGLTAHVYRVRAAGRDWTLKRARESALVKNIDGQTSFLNEIQRRADFARLKAAGAPGLQAIVDTTYASLRHGVLLSPWIDGEIVREWDERRLAQAIDALVACFAEGLFEWDPSPGNILDDGRQLWLFDFGYMYRFDPLRQFNSGGHGNDVPLFHPAERFETRNFSGVLLRLERKHGRASALAAFRLEKTIAIDAYRRLRGTLAQRHASAAVLAWLDGIVARWARALAGDIDSLYLAEAWRSHALDLEDDLRGQSCTPATLERADWLLDALTHHHAQLVAADAFFWHDATLDRVQLLARYGTRREQAQGFQLSPGPSC